MKIECTRGCVYDGICVDGERLDELNDDKKVELIDRIEKYILKKGFNKEKYQVEELFSEITSGDYSSEDNFATKLGITEDDETCEIFLNGKQIKDISEEEVKNILNQYINYLKETKNNCNFEWFAWWFMTDYVGLKYEYTCDECGDSVHSRTINI